MPGQLGAEDRLWISFSHPFIPYHRNKHLKAITVANIPSEFSKLLQKVNRVAMREGLQPIYALEVRPTLAI
jgi:hypothetical protein